MIFVGDIAHPFVQPPIWQDSHWTWLAGQSVVANLEGALVFNKELADTDQRGLFNHVSVVKALTAMNVSCVSLANNHIMDVSNALPGTSVFLQKKGISFTGAGETITDASLPAKIVEKDKKWLLLATGWETIQCKPVTPTESGVNPFKPDKLIKSVKEWRLKEPDAVIVLLPHWNYELELYPQPAHRQFAMAAIDAGADGVIGHHPHRVGGVEIYNGCPIAYSLGNWWMPHGVYFGGRLKFCDETLLQLALEWNPDNDIVCHWFEYIREGHQLIHKDSELFSKSTRISQLTPFAGMDYYTYKKWFSTHRVKQKALPIYKDYRHQYRNVIKDWYVHKRHSSIMFLEKIGLRSLLRM